MDKVTRYRNLVQTLMESLAKHFGKSNRWEIIEAYDALRGQYLLFTDGWRGEQREYGCFMHIEVKENGKVWLRRDGTDFDIGQQLLDSGVAQSDLVLAFHSPNLRALSDFPVS